MPSPILFAAGATDAELAAIVAERLGCALPPECVAGVAANARILERHAAILLGDEA